MSIHCFISWSAMRQMDMEAPAISILVAYSPTKVRYTLIPFCSRRRCTLPDRIYSSSWLVAPRPLISRQTSSPGFRGISPRISPTDSSARSSAVFTGPFHTPGSPWIPMPKAISSSARVKLEWPISGMTQGVRAKPTVLVLSFAFFAAASTSSSVPIRAALAPAHLYIKKIPATPRRTWASLLESTSSAPTMLAVLISSMSSISAAISKFIMSPV